MFLKCEAALWRRKQTSLQRHEWADGEGGEERRMLINSWKHFLEKFPATNNSIGQPDENWHLFPVRSSNQMSACVTVSLFSSTTEFTFGRLFFFLFVGKVSFNFSLNATSHMQRTEKSHLVIDFLERSCWNCWAKRRRQIVKICSLRSKSNYH